MSWSVNYRGKASGAKADIAKQVSALPTLDGPEQGLKAQGLQLLDAVLAHQSDEANVRVDASGSAVSVNGKVSQSIVIAVQSS